MLGNDRPRRGGSAATFRADARLKRHAELMAQYIAEGMSREAASKKAFAVVTEQPAGAGRNHK